MRVLNKNTTAIALLAAFAAVGCSGDGLSGPGLTPGTLVMSLNTPNVDDGAVSFRVEGGPMLTLTPLVDEERSYLFQVSGTTVTGAVLGTALGGDLISFDVPDIAAANSYRVTILDVANDSNVLRDSSTGYELRLRSGNRLP